MGTEMDGRHTRSHGYPGKFHPECALYHSFTNVSTPAPSDTPDFPSTPNIHTAEFLSGDEVESITESFTSPTPSATILLHHPQRHASLTTMCYFRHLHHNCPTFSASPSFTSDALPSSSLILPSIPPAAVYLHVKIPREDPATSPGRRHPLPTYPCWASSQGVLFGDSSMATHLLVGKETLAFTSLSWNHN